jgi:hypothetical protein
VPDEADYKSRMEIMKACLVALQTEVTGPTVFEPDITKVSG